MKLIIPMAGKGTRLRPLTQTTPKPLIPLIGKPMVKILVEQISTITTESITEIGFIIGDFGKETEKLLIEIAESIGAKASIFYQNEALGTAHAIYCAKELLNGKVIIAFVDSLFIAKGKINIEKDSIILVQNVPNPQDFGVVKLSQDEIITEFIEKPQTFVSDLAIIGVYYFKQSELLKDEIAYLIDNKIIVNSEYQLTTVLNNLLKSGFKFNVNNQIEWLDCGDTGRLLNSNKRLLENNYHLVDYKRFTNENSVIIEPCFIGDNCLIKNSVIGPNVSLSSDSYIYNSIINNSLVLKNVKIENICLTNSLIGNHVIIEKKINSIIIGDSDEYKNT
jgi:glucose-1-phosphate thymidylyltransferase